MTFRRLYLVLRCSLILFTVVMLPGAARAAIRFINVDFGSNNQQTNLPGWNNLSGPEGSEPTNTLNLIDVLGAATGITLTPSWSGTGDDLGVSGQAANFQGPYPMELPGISQQALRDSFYVRDGFTFTATLSNLPANTAYNFIFYGGAGNTGDYSLWTVTGSNSGSDFIDDLVNNGDQVATVNGIIPDSMQRISVRFEGRRPDGTLHSPGIEADALGRFNFMRMLQHSSMVGDFDANAVVDAMDYTTWRSAYDMLSHFSGADGNHNGVVDAADYVIWRKAMMAAGGSAVGSASGVSVPEPHAAALAALMFSLCSLRLWGRRGLPR